ncbi:Uncharacterised protein [Bordetella pertussis]|nr:Uncharacterised protein [Bordetella pertussis]
MNTNTPMNQAWSRARRRWSALMAASTWLEPARRVRASVSPTTA